MFSTAVHVQEGFFVKQDFKASSGEGFLKDFHHHHVLIDALTSFQEQRTELKLIDGDFIVSGLDWDSQLQKLIFNFFQNVFNLMGDLSVVMI